MVVEVRGGDMSHVLAAGHRTMAHRGWVGTLRVQLQRQQIFSGFWKDWWVFQFC